MYEFQNKRRRVTFKPRDKISKEIYKTLRCYENDVYTPQLPITLPMCLADFPQSGLRDEVQAPEPDNAGKLPDNDDLLYVTQLEATRLDGLNRSLIKLHENDKAMMSGMMQYIKMLEEATGARHEQTEVNPRDMMHHGELPQCIMANRFRIHLERSHGVKQDEEYIADEYYFHDLPTFTSLRTCSNEKYKGTCKYRTPFNLLLRKHDCINDIKFSDLPRERRNVE